MKFKLTLIMLLLLTFLCYSQVTFNERTTIPLKWDGESVGGFWAADYDNNGTEEIYVYYQNRLTGDHLYIVEYSQQGDTLNVFSQGLAGNEIVRGCKLYEFEDELFLIGVYQREQNNLNVCDLKIYEYDTMTPVASHTNNNFYSLLNNEFSSQYIEIVNDGDEWTIYLGIDYEFDQWDYWYSTTKMVIYTLDGDDLDLVEEVDGCGEELVYFNPPDSIIAIDRTNSGSYGNPNYPNYTNYTINQVNTNYPSSVTELLQCSSNFMYASRNDCNFTDYGMVIYQRIIDEYDCYSPDFSEIVWSDIPEGTDLYALEQSTCVHAQEGDHFLMNLYRFYPDYFLEIRDRINGDILLTQPIDFEPYDTFLSEDGELYIVGFNYDLREIYFYTLAEEINVHNDNNEIIDPVYSLSNYPNPFNPSTQISFTVPGIASKTTLKIFDIRGRKIKTLVNGKLAGSQSVIWIGDDDQGKMVSSGVYLYQLSVNGKPAAVNRMLLIK